MPYLNVLSKFRDDIRTDARLNKRMLMVINYSYEIFIEIFNFFKEISLLKICDDLRDRILPELGVRLEDRKNERTIIKLCDKETLLKEREQKLMVFFTAIKYSLPFIIVFFY
jgi:cysteinyl-tRNA synthetase